MARSIGRINISIRRTGSFDDISLPQTDQKPHVCILISSVHLLDHCINFFSNLRIMFSNGLHLSFVNIILHTITTTAIRTPPKGMEPISINANDHSVLIDCNAHHSTI